MNVQNFRDVAFLGRAGSGGGTPTRLDTIESYTNLDGLDGLNGGSNWGGAYVARSNAAGIQSFDTMEGYTNGAGLDGLDNGQFGGAYVARSNDIIASTLAAHWKADSFSLSDGTAIGGTGNEWQDQTANNNDAVQATGASQPLFKTNIFGSVPAIRFDGSNDFLSFPAISLSGDWTIIAITKNITTDCMLMGHSTLNRQVRLFQSGGNVLSLYDGTNNPVSGTFATAASGARMNVWKRGTPSNANFAGFYENNATDFSSGTITSLTLEWIGKYTGAILYLNGDLGELQVYTAALTLGQIQDLYTGYFKPKFGLP